MDGIIVINKEKEYTSHDVVAKLKKKLNISKVGHTGTLDPNATGVLPILIGKGTKFSKYLINHDKIYNVTLQLGEKTDTADSEGKVIETKEVKEETLKKENIEKIFEKIKGKQEQIPPIYSAIKVNGKKLYEYARKGQEVEIKPRKIEIYNIELLNINEKQKQIEFQVSCSKGTYIRSLCEDIAQRLETVGYMLELKRIQVGNFNIKEAITIEQLENNIDNKEFIEENFIQFEEIFKNKEKIELDDRKLRLFLNGVQLTIGKEDGTYKIYNNNKFIGIGIVENKLLKRDIVL